MSVTFESLITHFRDQLRRSPAAFVTESGSTHLLTTPPETSLPDCEHALSQLVASCHISDYSHVPALSEGLSAFLVVQPPDQGGAGTCDLSS